MAQTIVYGCDWCGTIVDKEPDGTPKFAAKITEHTIPRLAAVDPKTHKICATCHAAFKALTQGKYRR